MQDDTIVQEQSPEVQPFTYYRNYSSTENRWRAFLVAGIERFLNVPQVALIEWGKTREEPTRVPLKSFLTLVSTGQMQLFTPQL